MSALCSPCANPRMRLILHNPPPRRAGFAQLAPRLRAVFARPPCLDSGPIGKTPRDPFPPARQVKAPPPKLRHPGLLPSALDTLASLKAARGESRWGHSIATVLARCCSLGLPLGRPWVALGSPLGCPWVALGLPLGCPWVHQPGAASQGRHRRPCPVPTFK
jgi:hypothetical protein